MSLKHTSQALATAHQIFRQPADFRHHPRTRPRARPRLHHPYHSTPPADCSSPPPSPAPRPALAPRRRRRATRTRCHRARAAARKPLPVFREEPGARHQTRPVGLQGHDHAQGQLHGVTHGDAYTAFKGYSKFLAATLYLPASGPHLWFHYVNYPYPGLSRPQCGEVDAATRMPPAIFLDKKALALYVEATESLWPGTSVGRSLDTSYNDPVGGELTFSELRGYSLLVM